MARIRTIKPEFFRHEGLQDLEAENPGSCVMLVFAGLWGHCDKAGRFEWKPRMLKLDILPFIEFDMGGTLALLCEAGFLRKYEIDGKQYGEIYSFEKHQRINGKEAQEPEKHPAPRDEAQEVNKGSNGEATGKHLPAQEGKGKEEEGKRKGTEYTGPPSTEEVELLPAVADATSPAKAPRADTALQAACRETFREYQQAYAARYGAPHVDNAKVRSQIKQFVQRIGRDESPLVAAWYVQHPGAKYVASMHGMDCLLKDAEKLRTEWATGRVVTSTAARQSDRRGAMTSALQNLLAECEGGAQ